MGTSSQSGAPDTPAVSVIIPVYNTREYLSDAVDSVLGQTLPASQILLIDDGSTDGSAELCDWYSEHFETVQTIHQTNQGIANARNVGIANSTGDYILFVDSDDIVKDTCLQETTTILTTENADLTLFNYHKFSQHDTRLVVQPNIPRNTIFSGSGPDACAALFSSEFDDYSWDFVARRALYTENGIRFPEGRVYEDKATNYKLLLAASKVCRTSEILYYYRQRSNSIVHTASLRSSWDDLEIIEERKSFITTEYPNLKRLCEARAYPTYIGEYKNSLEIQYSAEAREMRRLITSKLHYYQIVGLPTISPSTRVQAILVKLHLLGLLYPLLKPLKFGKN
jgi:glycosyltransferase involved in cell wall biosynthesis